MVVGKKIALDIKKMCITVGKNWINGLKCDLLTFSRFYRVPSSLPDHYRIIIIRHAGKLIDLAKTG